MIKPCICYTFNSFLQITGGDNIELRYRAEVLMAVLMSRLKEMAETELGYRVSSVVMVVPADFTRSQLQAMSNTAMIAGLKVAKFLTSG